MRIYNLSEIKPLVSKEHWPDIITAVENGFIRYSSGEASIPPVGLLQFPELQADVHIKYGYIKDSDYFCVKIADGFPLNASAGLPASSGVILLFSSKTGFPEAILQDEGYLTDLRTAAAGAICAKHLCPSDLSAVGIVGTGIQARWQLRLLSAVLDVPDVYVFGRNRAHAEEYQRDMSLEGFHVTIASSVEELCHKCDLVVTTTYSKTPLIHKEYLHKGMHITAMGCDSPGKHEIAPECFSSASLCVVDSLSQCTAYGDSSFAVQNGIISPDKLIELGTLISAGVHRNDEDITISDLTGVAVQDIAISEYVCNKLKSLSSSHDKDE